MSMTSVKLNPRETPSLKLNTLWSLQYPQARYSTVGSRRISYTISIDVPRDQIFALPWVIICHVSMKSKNLLMY